MYHIIEKYKLSSLHLMVVILGLTGVFGKLEEMFKGFEDNNPEIIILIGDFIGNSFKDLGKTLSLFENLAILISSFPNLSTKTEWVLIPGIRYLYLHI